MDRTIGLELARSLASLHPSGFGLLSPRLDAAVRCVLFDLWSHTDRPSFEREIAPRLAAPGLERRSSVCGPITGQEEERRAYLEDQDPEVVRQRREEKRRLRQEKHAERLALKRDRDRIWREAHVAGTK